MKKKIQTSYPSNVKEFERCNASWIDHLRVFKYSELAQRMPLLAGIVASTQRISRRAGLGPLRAVPMIEINTVSIAKEIIYRNHSSQW